VRGAPEDPGDRVHVLLGHAQVDHPAQHLQVLDLVVVIDGLVVLREREAERAVVDVGVLVAQPGEARRFGQAVATPPGEEALDRQLREPPGRVGGVQLLARAPVRTQSLEQREP
jgi:hypothetical protein